MTNAEMAREAREMIGSMSMHADPIKTRAVIEWLLDFAEGRAIKCGAKPRAWASLDEMNDLRRGFAAIVQPRNTGLSTTPLYAPQEEPGE